MPYGLALLLLCLSLVAQGAQWPLKSVHFEAPHTATQYLYVPGGQTFHQPVLNLTITGGSHEDVLSLYLDHKLLFSSRVHPHQSLRIPLPDLSTGFHRLDFVGNPIQRAPVNEENTECVPFYRIPFALEDLHLTYTPLQRRTPYLSEFPDGLFNRSFPRKEPWRGRLLLMPLDEKSTSAAARLVSALRADAGILWQVDPQRRASADFEIIIIGTDTLDTLKNLPRLPRLIIPYETEEQLNGIIHFLTNTHLRQITGTIHRLYIEAPQIIQPPPRAVLHQPESLHDFGFTDIRLTGNQARQLRLNLPVWWQPIEPPQGQIVIRHSNPMPPNAYVNVWINNTLAGTRPLYSPTKEKMDAIVPFTGKYLLKTPHIDLRIHPFLNRTFPCAQPLPGTLWVDPRASTITIPHRTKQGVASYIPRLVGQPTISIDGHPAALSFALALVQTQQQVIRTGEVPYRVRITREPDAQSILHIGVSPEKVDTLLEQLGRHVPRQVLDHALLLVSPAPGHLYIWSRTPEALRQATRKWPYVFNRLEDGVTHMLVDAETGTVEVLRRTPLTQAKPQSRVDRQTYLDTNFLIIVALALLALLLIVTRMIQRYRKTGGAG